MNYLAVAAIFCYFLTGNVQTANYPQGSASEPLAFTSIGRIGDPGYRSFFMFSTESGRGYTVRADGYSENSDGKTRPRNFSFPLGQSGNMVRFYMLEYEGDLLALYEVSNSDSGWGYLVRLNQKTLKPKWTMPISGFNIGPGLVESDQAYFSAANLFAKVDLKTGKYLWQQEDPQKQFQLGFAGFRLPQLEGEKILFPEDRPKGKTVAIEKASGKILAVRD